jgi:uroporphyrin-III C-methyltransferase/precorrin-2 dehydrogenase/sirohydrochlorin ferrochelatase
MEHLPIFLKLKGRTVLVVGGGDLAARRVDLLSRAGAIVTVVAGELCEDLERMVARGLAEHRSEAVSVDRLRDCALAFGAAEDAAENVELHRLAAQAGIPVNVVDRIDLSSFFMPAVVDRSPLVVAVSSGGKAPIIVRILKAQLERLIPASYGVFAAFAGGWRERVAGRLEDQTRRRRFWENVNRGPVPAAVLAGNPAEAERLMAQSLNDAAHDQDAVAGEVYLVGAGPGDADLLTIRALRLMQQADVVLYDRLIGDGILNLVRRDAERIFVGKRPKEHTVPQDEIGSLMVRLARDGKRVLRLKGGDPFIFGRGGEEIEVLARQGVSFQVVPGVTAAAGCASYAGIPLTHRDHAQSCIFITGHGKDGLLDLNWPALVQPRQTVVIYMGLGALEQLMEGYAANGGDADMPAAIIENGTLRTQRVVTGTVKTLAEQARQAEIHSPALIIIGTVVTLRQGLSWYAREAEPESAEILPGAILR